MSEDYVMWAVLVPQNALPADMATGDPESLWNRALEAARPFHPVLRHLVAQADVEFTLVVTLNRAIQPKSWPTTRATLMGDAVHVMPPLGAHGGNTALRDAALLAEKLQDAAAHDKSLEMAVRAYQAEMLDYAFKEVTSAMSMLRRSTTRNPLVRVAMLRALPWFHSLTGSAPIAAEEGRKAS